MAERAVRGQGGCDGVLPLPGGGEAAGLVRLSQVGTAEYAEQMTIYLNT